jgi:DNA helicase-2/ATP-dependent DNA helicase PcrA
MAVLTQDWHGTSVMLDSLNPPQLQAVTHTGAPLLVIAGAGSGKTRVLTQRIAYLLAEKNVSPDSILAITFTNKAAAEMKERVRLAVGPAANQMWVSTFHSACVRILRKDAKLLGRTSTFSIYDQSDSTRLVSSIMESEGIDQRRFTPRSLLAQISRQKSELIDVDTFAARAESPTETLLVPVYREYERRLAMANAFDFDDLISATVALFQLDPDLAMSYRERFRHVLVDEYQDTNPSQYALVKEMVGATGELCVVGDADQAIYAFRGATIRNIEEFERDFPEARVITLDQNYRSTQTVLTAANAVISKNSDRREKHLWTSAGQGESILGYVAFDEHDEARFVAREIKSALEEGRGKYSDVAVFYRTNAQSRALEEVFIRAGVPYRVVGSVKFYERKEVKDALAYLRLVVNPADDLSFLRIINTPRRGIGDKAVENLTRYARKNKLTLLQAAKSAQELNDITNKARDSMIEFVKLIDAMSLEVSGEHSPSEVIAKIFERTGYLNQLLKSDDPQEQARAENLIELEAVAREFENTPGEAPTLAAFLERVSLVSDADEIPDHEDGMVSLMTLHTAKGLEFPLVFMTGVEEGVFPHQRALADPTQLSEERRLAYVGITRAMSRLHVSRAASRTWWGSMVHNPPSRFLSEIPEELIEWHEVTNQSDTPSKPDNETDFSIGDRVLHAKFGVGTVIEAFGAGPKAQVSVDFGDGSIKKLLVGYAGLEHL